MTDIETISAYADFVTNIDADSIGEKIRILRSEAAPEELRRISEASLRKHIPAFIAGFHAKAAKTSDVIEEMQKQIKTLSFSLELSQMDHANDIDMFVCMLDTLTDTNVDTLDTKPDTTDTTIVSKPLDTSNTMCFNIDTSDTETQANPMNTDVTETKIHDTLEAMIPEIATRVLEHLKSLPLFSNAYVSKRIPKPDTVVDSTTGIPKRFLGWRVVMGSDGRYRLANGKTSIYVGKDWDAEKAEKAIAKRVSQ